MKPTSSFDALFRHDGEDVGNGWGETKEIYDLPDKPSTAISLGPVLLPSTEVMTA
ncbi:hypothetical protein MD484_g8277, partial [Candolleomyces efflorescens]